MTIPNDILTEACDHFRFGLDSDGKPWAYETGKDRPWPLTGRENLAEFRGRVGAIMFHATDAFPGEGHLREAVANMVALARNGEVLPEILTVPPVLAEPPEGSIDLGQGDVRVVRSIVTDLNSGRDDIYRSGTTLTQALRADDGRIVLAPMAHAQEFVSWADTAGFRFHSIHTDREGNETITEEFLPGSWASQVLRWGRLDGVLPVAGVSRVPLVLDDGTILAEDGYAHGLYFDIDDDLKGLDIPDRPTGVQVKEAVEVVVGVYAGFPFVDEASRVNAIGLAMTAACLRAMRPEEVVPIHAAIARAQGTGKTVVGADLPGTFAGGSDSPTYTDDEAEIRKVVTTALADTSARVLCFDNVPPDVIFESGVLAKLTTATRWTDRLLGSNTQVSRPQDRVFTVTGNNLRIGRDLAARTVPIWLDARMERPGEREFEVRLDDAATLRALRPTLVKAALTIVRAWVLAGSPEASNEPTMRQFTAWARRCGGLLEFMGLHGHLGNLASLVEQDEDSLALGVMYEALHERFGDTEFTTAEALQALGEQPHLDEHLPSWIAEKIERVEGVSGPPKFSVHAAPSLRKSVGKTLGQRVGEFHGGLAVEKVREDRKNYARWRFYKDGQR